MHGSSALGIIFDQHFSLQLRKEMTRANFADRDGGQFCYFDSF